VEALAAELCRAAGHDVPRNWRPLGKNELAERALLGVAGTQRMRDVVRHISAFSGFDDEARLTEVDVATALHAAVEMGTSEHVLRVRVVTHCDDVPDVRANPQQLTQALLSLLIAAAHSCEQGDPRERELGVRIRQQAAEVVVEVGDSRSGPNTKRSDTILDPFRSASREGNGSELGLSLCATVIASFAGRVLVGRGGGRFVVRLPCATG
jgi:C4-dicarboxylate-specific signal transduction histidine kinase